MLKLRKKKDPCAGSVLFRGSPAPRPEHMDYLERAGIALGPAKRDERGWKMKVSSTGGAWGPAEVLALDLPLPPKTVAMLQPGLSEADLGAFDAAGHSLQVVVPPEGKGALRDRKRLLWYLRQVMGADGLIAMDHQSGLTWTRAALDDELTHDADVDVEALYCLHAVYAGEPPPEGSDEEPEVYWAHTHGLGELGALDIDILRPSRGATHALPDAIRCLAFGVLEGSISAGDVYQFAEPRGVARFVDAAAFDRSAAPHCRDIRDAADHTERRVVLCEPKGGAITRFLRPGYQPCRFFTRAVDENCIFRFSTAATDLMTQRARATIPVFRGLVEEFKEMPATALVKLGYATGDAMGAEHLWFEVHAADDDFVDATLLNQPFADLGMNQGDRGPRPLELLSDWSIATPAGMISPRSLAPARLMREHRSEIMAMMV